MLINRSAQLLGKQIDISFKIKWKMYEYLTWIHTLPILQAKVSWRNCKKTKPVKLTKNSYT